MTVRSLANGEPIDRTAAKARSPIATTGDGFVALYSAAHGTLTSQLYAYLGDRKEAEDVVQEAFLRVWQRWGRLEGCADPMAWFRRVAWNLATSRWRRVRV